MKTRSYVWGRFWLHVKAVDLTQGFEAIQWNHLMNNLGGPWILEMSLFYFGWLDVIVDRCHRRALSSSSSIIIIIRSPSSSVFFIITGVDFVDRNIDRNVQLHHRRTIVRQNRRNYHRHHHHHHHRRRSPSGRSFSSSSCLNQSVVASFGRHHYRIIIVVFGLTSSIIISHCWGSGTNLTLPCHYRPRMQIITEFYFKKCRHYSWSC